MAYDNSTQTASTHLTHSTPSQPGENPLDRNSDITAIDAPENSNEASRVALIGIIVQNADAVEKLNSILHEHRKRIIGRMGIPCPSKGLSVISVCVDAPTDEISALAGRIGMLRGVSSKTIYPKLQD